MELKQTFPLIFFKLFLSLVPPCPHFVLFSLKELNSRLAVMSPFFSVVVHCLLFCPPPPSVLILMFSYVSATETKQKISFFPSLSVALLNPYLLLSFSLFQLFFFDLSPISPALFYCLISWQLQQYSSERARWNPESTVTFVSHWGHYQWQAISCNAF